MTASHGARLEAPPGSRACTSLDLGCDALLLRHFSGAIRVWAQLGLRAPRGIWSLATKVASYRSRSLDFTAHERCNKAEKRISFRVINRRTADAREGATRVGFESAFLDSRADSIVVGGGVNFFADIRAD
jgi:hypothetical protein